jgi:hypothetical protein
MKGFIKVTSPSPMGISSSVPAQLFGHASMRDKRASWFLGLTVVLEDGDILEYLVHGGYAATNEGKSHPE